jgi:SAM-dependent methyltransferase
VYPIVRFIPRFVPAENYAGSFGYQWNTYVQTQVDRAGETLSEARFFEATRWPRDLHGQRLLEAGSGAGRFTAIALATGAHVSSLDYSSAVDANLKNQGHHPALDLVQGDIFHIPFAPGSFDKVMCLGVLQHTPDPEAAFHSLVAQLAPGGQIAIDCYALKPSSLVNPKYLLRPVTRHVPLETLHAVVDRAVRTLLPLKRWLTEDVPLGRFPAFLIPVAYQQAWRELAPTPERLVELSVLDTFDWYSPRYDHPQTRTAVRRWFAKAGLADVDVGYGPNGVVGRGVKPR